MPFQIVRNDITRMDTDAIVNAANRSLEMGGGVCGAIFNAAGARELQAECDRIGGCETGQAVITGGYRLPARHIIHAVGPVWQGGGHGEEALLRSCYSSALQLAEKHRLKSVAFPLISSGIYGYPKDQALRVAVSAIEEFLAGHEMQVFLVVFDRQSFQIGEALFDDIARYIDDNYADQSLSLERLRRRPPQGEGLLEKQVLSLRTEALAPAPALAPVGNLQKALESLDISFSESLLKLIDQRGMTDVEVYKRANLDRKLFSKIRAGKGYNPSKPTAIALAVALRLNLEETRALLARAGYTLSPSSKADVIVRYFIERGNHNIHEINEALFAFDQALLGG